MAAYSPTSPCGHGCLPNPGTVPQVGWPLRAGRLFAMVLVLMAGIGVAAAQPLLTPAGRAQATRSWFRWLLAAAGVRLVTSGPAALTAGRGTLVVSNHVSWLDIPAVLAVESMRVLAKSDVRAWPVIGAMAARGGTLFIDRQVLRRLPGTVADIAESLRCGQSVLVFPEGSTWCGRTHGRYHPATFQAAIDAGAPVRPVSLRYRLADGSPTTVAAFLGTDTLIASVLRVVSTRGLVVELAGAPLITPAEAPARRTLSALAASPASPRVDLGRIRVS